MRKAQPRGSRVEVVESLSLTELTTFCHTDPDWVVQLVDHGVVTPITPSTQEWEFAPKHIARARKAARLMRDLGLNVAGVAVVLDLLEERDRLVRKLAMMDV